MLRPALVAILVVINASGQAGKVRDHSDLLGATPSVLSTALTQLPPGTHICAMYVYPTFSRSSQLALLTASEAVGWEVRIYDYNYKSAQLALQWQSGKLPPEFEVSSSAHFRLVAADTLRDGEDVEFSGCMQHDCPGSNAVLVYSPSRRRVARPFSFDTTITEGAPPFAVFKGWEPLTRTQEFAGSHYMTAIVPGTRPCKERKDGAPSPVVTQRVGHPPDASLNCESMG